MFGDRKDSRFEKIVQVSRFNSTIRTSTGSYSDYFYATNMPVSDCYDARIKSYTATIEKYMEIGAFLI